MVRLTIATIISLQLLIAIDINSIYHFPNDLFYVNPVAGEIKLKAKTGNLTDAYVVLGNKTTKMTLGFSEDNFDYFVADLARFDTTISYHFIIKDKLDSLNLPLAGEFKPKVPMYTKPDWASGKIGYFIFPDGFFNGNPENDPTDRLAWEDKPLPNRSYGGDFAGIIKKIAYLDSLDPDLVVLAPIFKAYSNHKFDPCDYLEIDPSFGDTTDLKILIDELHTRNKKVILSMVFSHTGIDFPAFVDVRKNSDSSAYRDWYHFKTMPVKMSPPNYECWRSDFHFPKLNLQNAQVTSYLLGYLEYWKKFGFDGFYIGEDETLEGNFVKYLHAYAKAKSPDLLLLGSDAKLVGVNGFDGTWDQTLTDLLIAYFVNNTMTTSDFDHQIRKYLFFKTPQAYCANLVSLSNYDLRIQSLIGFEGARNLYAFILTFCGSPCIIYGDEIGMSECATLNPGGFNWNTKEQNRNALEEIKRLVKIRKANPQFSKKYFYPIYVNDITKVYAYDRGGLIVVLNSGPNQSVVRLPAWDGVYLDLISGDKLVAEAQTLRLSISAKSYRILKREI